MPEGPEIAREADRIRDAIEGQEVDCVRFAFERLRHHTKSFEGARVQSVTARGKAMLIAFDNELTIYSHNQLYGRWFVRSAGSLPPTRRQLRLAIETRAKWALLYSASQIDVLDEVAVAHHPYLSKLGPDALTPTLACGEIVDRLEDARFARRGLGALLLDQSFVAGLGNYLRSEICFEARIHPGQSPRALDPAGRRRLARAILVMTRRAYESGGVTLPRSRAAKLRKQGATWSQGRHWVFAREGEPCRRCDAQIERFTLAGRRAYACARCQPKNHKHG